MDIVHTAERWLYVVSLRRCRTKNLFVSLFVTIVSRSLDQDFESSFFDLDAFLPGRNFAIVEKNTTIAKPLR